jgi:hypothetical protein
MGVSLIELQYLYADAKRTPNIVTSRSKRSSPRQMDGKLPQTEASSLHRGPKVDEEVSHVGEGRQDYNSVVQQVESRGATMDMDARLALVSLAGAAVVFFMVAMWFWDCCETRGVRLFHPRARRIAKAKATTS